MSGLASENALDWDSGTPGSFLSSVPMGASFQDMSVSFQVRMHLWAYDCRFLVAMSVHPARVPYTHPCAPLGGYIGLCGRTILSSFSTAFSLGQRL